MKVLHIVTAKSWRGGENQLFLLLRGLKNLGVESHVIVQVGSDLGKAFAPWAQIHEVRMRNDIDIVAAGRIAMICKKHKFDAIHAHTARAHSVGLIAKNFLKWISDFQPRLIVHRRVEHGGNSSILQRWKYLNSKVDQFVCVSKFIAAGMKASGIPESRVRTVYSAVDPSPYANRDELRASFRREFQIEAEQFVISYVGAIEPAKGSDVLMDAWQNLQCRNFQGKLFMVGNGALLEPLKERSQVAGLSDSIVFTGFRTDVHRILAGSDILVLPTCWEGLGTILLEGLLAGCALIGSNVGGVPEIIQDHATGLLVPPRDSTALADAISRLATDHDLRQRLVQAGQRHVAANFSLNEMVQGNFDVYSK